MTNTRFGHLLDCYRQLLHLPNPTPVLAVLGTVAANRLAGDPVWVMLVGPPSSGKTEIVDSLRLLPEGAAVSTLTKASLLSAQAGGSGGLLLTKFRDGSGLLLVKDFTSLLSDVGASEIIALLREVFDGHVERYVGNQDAPLAWAGKIGLVGAVTEEIESHRTAIAVMGERFVYVPMPDNSPEDRAAVVAMAIANTRRARTLRDELAANVSAFFAELGDPQLAAELSGEEQSWVADAADFASRARSPVLRDGRSREISLVPEPEVGARLAVELSQLARGLAWVGATRPQRDAVIRSAVQASIPRIRRVALNALLDGAGSLSTTEIALNVRLSSSTVRRELEDLTALKLLDTFQEGAAYRQHWSASTIARDHWQKLTRIADANPFAQ